jgi:hypothetical protein
MNIPDAVRVLERELGEIFGGRLRSLVVYAPAISGTPTPTLAIVDGLSADDLRACAARAGAWHDRELATPLVLESGEFARSLDAFPLEFGAILADHAVVTGANPFDGCRVDPADLRRACEVQARSHLLHLREGFIETQGRGDAIAALIMRSAAPLAALIDSVHRLNGARLDDPVLTRVAQLNATTPLSSDGARGLFPAYLAAIEALTRRIDQWTGA